MAGKPNPFWSDDRGLPLLLLLVAASIFVVGPLVEMRLVGNLTLAAVFSLILASGVSVVGRRWSVPLAALAAVTIVVRWASLAVGSSSLAVLDAACSLLSCAALAAIVTVQVFRAGPINKARIQGAVAVYLLLGLSWAVAYELVELVRPDAFASTAAPANERFHFVYFSFVVLTTVGFGDITPVDPIARSLASLEALVGQLYPAILLARLVSMEFLSER